MKKINQKITGAAISLLLIQSIFATGNSLDNYKSGVYIGAQAGYATIDDGSNIRDYAMQVAPSGDVNINSNNIGEKIFIGFSGNPFIAFEAGGTFYPNKYYKDIGNDYAIFTTKMYSIDVMGKGTLPLEKISQTLAGWNIYTKLGMSWGFASYIINKKNGVNVSIDQSSPGFGYGLGVEYKFTDHFGIDFSWSGLLSIKKPYFNNNGGFVYGETIIYNRTPNFNINYTPSTNLFAIGLTYKF